jgi:uncharacterized protein
MDIAVIGSGIAGLGAAWALSRSHVVTLYEADDHLGGHAQTVEIEDGDRSIPVDTGFIVYNESNYPNLVRLFAETRVPTEPSDMSFSVSMAGGEFEYQARALGLLSQPSNLLRPRYLGMVRDILRFGREAPALLGADSSETIGEYLARAGYGDAFVKDFLLPELACIWSSSLDEMRDPPAAWLVRFLDNHDLLRVTQRPRWRTVTGGSREYVRRVAAPLGERARTATPVTGVRRDADGAWVTDGQGGRERFGHVVFATHADTTLGLLGGDASSAERRILGTFGFQANRAVLHRDPSLMPRRRRAWSSWNYLAEDRARPADGRDDDPRRVSLTYWMNRLQNLDTERPVFVTLNPHREPNHVVGSWIFHHPRYDRAAVDAQASLGRIQGDRRSWFCGAWTGFGFHEDGLRSGLEVAAALGSPAPWWPTTSRAEGRGARIGAAA